MCASALLATLAASSLPTASRAAAQPGIAAGLLASLLWAAGSLVFSTVRAPAVALNMYKNVVGALCFLAAVSMLALAGRTVLPGPAAFGWLSASALVGIVLGDTLYFRSLLELGPRRALVLTTFSPSLAALLGWLFLGEGLRLAALLGLFVTTIGVVWVVREGTAASPAPEGPLARRLLARGAGSGVLAAFCQAAGAVLSKEGMRDLDPLPASAVRLIVAAVACVLIALLSGRMRAFAGALLAPGVPGKLALASVSGTFLGIWMSLVAQKYTPVAVATTLTSMSPVFVLPLAFIFLGQPVALRAVLGAAVAVGGVALLV